eukprot:scaffold4290_cov213-Chaetoceros_neogracile.AAC.3
MATPKSTFITITLSVTIIIATYLISKPVSKYGLSGALRLIWEGDHLPPHIRDCFDKLQQIDDTIKKQKKKLNRLGVTIETAKLNSVDEIQIVNNEHIPKKHYILSQVPSLHKDLGIVSSALDKVAAELDQVVNHGVAEVKRQKKELSNRVVTMMGTCDGFIQECDIDTTS